MEQKKLEKTWRFEIGETGYKTAVFHKEKMLDKISAFDIQVRPNGLTKATVEVLTPAVNVFTINEDNVEVSNKEAVIREMQKYIQLCRITPEELYDDLEVD
jgi:hypothetical protein